MKKSSVLNTQSLQRHYPAEWEIQESVWLAWPHNENEWKNNLKGIRQFYEKLIGIILKFQNVNLIFPAVGTILELPVASKKRKLKKIVIPNNDIWIRDYGPFFMKQRRGEITSPLLIDFEFNAWGGKFPPWDLDNNVPREIALYKGSEIESYPLILEGGALEFSGDGVALTTEECVLSETRNKNISREQIEEVIKRAFNIEEIIWLKNGLLHDHTDGHIDNVARFIDSRKILICRSEKKDENYERLQPSIEYLKKWKHPVKGYKLEIIELLLPENNDDGPKSYANFIFVNGGIIVPTFNCKTDEKALELFKKLFPEKEIVEIDCSLLIQEGGGLHCMTKQEPFIAD